MKELLILQGIIYVWYRMLPESSVRYKVPGWLQQIAWQKRWAPWKEKVLWYCKVYNIKIRAVDGAYILVISYTHPVLFDYLLDINIWVKHSNPYGNQHSRYEMFIANTKRKALWSLLNDIRRTTSDWIAWWVYARNYIWINLPLNAIFLRRMIFMNNKFIFIPDKASRT